MNKIIRGSLLVIVFLMIIKGCFFNEETIKTKESSVNVPIDCSGSLESIKSEINEKCYQISNDYYLGKILWNFEGADFKREYKYGTLEFTFCKPINAEYGELYDVIIDVASCQITSIKRYGNQQIGVYYEIDKELLRKNLEEYACQIKNDSELQKEISQAMKTSVALEIFESRISVAIFSTEAAGAKIRKYIGTQEDGSPVS